VSQGSFGTPPPSSPPQTPEKKREKKGFRALLFLWNFIDTLPIAPVVLVLICLPLALDLGIFVLSPVVVVVSFLQVCKFASLQFQCMGPGPEFWDSSISAGN
jgi:hypothetical protein